MRKHTFKAVGVMLQYSKLPSKISIPYFLSSHEVVISFLLSLEAFSFIAIVTIISCSTHDISDHSNVVVELVAFTTTTFYLWSLLFGLCLLLLILELLVVNGLQIVFDLADLLGVASGWKVFAKLFEKVLNPVGSFSSQEGSCH